MVMGTPSSDGVFSLSVSERRNGIARVAQVVHLHGELDIASVARLRATMDNLLVDGPTQVIVVDLTDLTFIDSSGLGALVGAHRKARVLKCTLRVVCGEGMARRVIEMTGLQHVLATADSVERAVAL